jgi:glycogen synthase
MQKALHTFRHTPDKIREMQREAAENIYRNYTWDMVLQRYLALYHEALKQLSRS